MGKQARKQQNRKKEKTQALEQNLSHMAEPWQRLYELIQKKVK